MMQPGRKFAQGTSNYRYTINGQEKSDELNVNQTTAMFWEYDSRIGRRWNVDPAFAKNPSESPYLTFHNNPTFFNDLFGDDPPAGFTKYTGQGGDLYIPSSATINSSLPKGSNATRISDFKIGDKTFTGRYDKSGGFTGYYNGEDKYENPDITLKSGGYAHGVLDVTFSIKNAPGDGLEAIQIESNTAYVNSSAATRSMKATTGRAIPTDGFLEGRYSYTSGADLFSAEVDGGIGSLYADSYRDARNPSGGKHGPVYQYDPYYVGSGDEASGILPSMYTNSGDINIYDKPTSLYTEKKMFTTMIVVRNYLNTGIDVVIGTFRWGMSSFGRIVTGSADLKGNNPDSNDLNTLNKFYPSYQLLQKK